MDSIAKPGEDDGLIPPNVANAVNFYQAGGVLHGRAEIVASDPLRTKIIANFQMTYKDHPIKCYAFPRFARTFMKFTLRSRMSRAYGDRQPCSLIQSYRSQYQPISRNHPAIRLLPPQLASSVPIYKHVLIS